MTPQNTTANTRDQPGVEPLHSSPLYIASADAPPSADHSAAVACNRSADEAPTFFAAVLNIATVPDKRD